MRCINVVAAIIPNNQQEVFVTQRPQGNPLAGLWEFPGGKIEPNETAFQALVRECQEELDITITQARLFAETVDQTEDMQVNLAFWWVDNYAGQPFGREGQVAEWVPMKALAQRQFPKANAALLDRLVNFGKG